MRFSSWPPCSIRRSLTEIPSAPVKVIISIVQLNLVEKYHNISPRLLFQNEVFAELIPAQVTPLLGCGDVRLLVAVLTKALSEAVFKRAR